MPHCIRGSLRVGYGMGCALGDMQGHPVPHLPPDWHRRRASVYSRAPGPQQESAVTTGKRAPKDTAATAFAGMDDLWRRAVMQAFGAHVAGGVD